MKATRVATALNTAADVCDLAEAPEVEAEARTLLSSAFRARGAISEMVVRLDLAGGDFLGQIVDAGWRQPAEPTNPNPQPRPDPTPQPQPKQPDPPPPPPNDVIFDLCEQVDQAAQILNQRIEELPEDERRRVCALPDALSLIAQTIQDRVAEAIDDVDTLNELVASGQVKVCPVCGDHLPVERMVEHRAKPPAACVRAAREKGELVECPDGCGDMVPVTAVETHREWHHS